MLRVVQKKAVRILILALFLSTFFVLPTFADDVDYSVSVTDSLKLTIPKTSINLNLDPSIKPFDSEDLTVIVGTNSAVGYQLIMSSDTTNLVKTDDDTKTIPTLDPLEGGYTLDNFTVNKWGYKVGAGNYVPFVSGDTIVDKDVIANNDTNVINFATKIDFLQSAGEYNMTLTFTAVAHLLATYMQDFDLDMCTESPQEIIDLRDGETYLVQKLADGNCWMLDNLRLDPTEVSLETLRGNTNAPDNILGYFKNGGGSDAYPAYGVSAWTSSTQNSYTSPSIYANDKNNVAPVTYGSGSSKIGVYYNYCAASAGSYCYTNTEGTGDAIYDICPTRWRLPKGGSVYNNPTNELNNLYLAYNSDATNFRDALSASLTGNSYNGAAYVQGTYGYFWSSTFSSTSQMHSINFDSSSIWPGYTDGRDYGRSVRCLLKPQSTITFHTSNAAGIKFDGRTYTDGQSAKVSNGVHQIEGIYDSRQAFQSWNASTGAITNANYVDYNLNTYEVTQDATITLTGRTTNLALQDVTDATCSTAPAPAYDNRDGQTYWIKKLDDGRCWMMDNLNLGAITLTTDLTSANTNVADTVSADTFNSWKQVAGEVQSSYTEGQFIPVTPSNSASGSDVDSTSGTKFGTLYNYCAASAGTMCVGYSFTDATGDICPKGWHMPTVGETGDASVLYNNESYNTNAKMRAPVSENGAAFAIAGSFYNSMFSFQDNNQGVYWSSTGSSTPPYMAAFVVTPTFISITGGNYMDNGYSVRCILK